MSRTALHEGVVRALVSADARHYKNHPAFAAAHLQDLAGMLRSLLIRLPDDPALAACTIRDVLPRLYAYLWEVDAWAYAVNESSPDDIPTTGARSCLYST